MSEIVLLAIFFTLFVGLLFGQPLAFVLGGIGVVFGLLGGGSTFINIVISNIFGVMQNYNLVAIPLFVLMANFLMKSDIVDKLFEQVHYLLGSLRGGLAVAVILVSTVFAATTGIVGASVITMGLLGLPILKKYGYQKELSLGVVCAGGTLGILIPPSIMLVIMGSIAQVSVGKLFLAAIIPGLLLSLSYMIYILFICWKKPEIGPAISKEEVSKISYKKVIRKTLVYLIPPLILIIGVLGSIFGGIATPTEAAGMGAAITLIMVFFYRKFSLKMLRESVIETGKITAMCLIILVGAVTFKAMFVSLGGDELIKSIIMSLNLSRWGVYFIFLLIMFILGCFIDWMGIVMIIFPLFLPILVLMGFDKLWVVASSAVLLQTCFLTPPFGYALFYIKGIVSSDVKIIDIYRGVMPFIFIILTVVIIVIIFPELLTFLPNLIFK